MRARVLLLLAAASCGDASIDLVEPSTGADVRVIAILGDAQASAVARGGAAVFSASVVAAGDTAQVWVLAYSSAGLVARFPPLAGRSAEEIAAAIDPRFDDPEGVEPPEAAQVLRSPLESPLAFKGAAWGEWIAASRMRLRFHLGGASPTCAGIRSEEVALPSGLVAGAAAALDDDTILLADTFNLPDPSGPMPVARVDGFAVTRLSIRGLRGRALAMVQDYRGQAYVATDYMDVGGSQNVFRVDREGRLNATPPVRLLLGDSLFASDDQTVLARRDRIGYQFAAGSTTAVAWPSIPETWRTFGYNGEGRAAFWDGSSLWFGANGAWTKEHEFPFAAEQLFVIGGDTEVMAAGGVYEAVYLRDEGKRTWSKLPAPFSGGHVIRSIAGLHRGRFAVGADRSGLAIWTGASWCVVPVTANTSFLGLSASPSGHTLLGIGVIDPSTPSGRHALIRVRLP